LLSSSDAIRNVPSIDRSTVVDSFRAPAFLTFYNHTTDTVHSALHCCDRCFAHHNKCHMPGICTAAKLKSRYEFKKLITARISDSVKCEKHTENKRKPSAYPAAVENPPSKTTSSRSGNVVRLGPNNYVSHDNRTTSRPI